MFKMFLLIYLVIFILTTQGINSQISDKRLCANKDCTEPISKAKTLNRYFAPDSRILSFAPNEDVTIYSKSAGSKVDLWGGEINGKRGYVPKMLIRETKILKKDLNFLLPTELNDTVTTETQNQAKTDESNLKPDKVQAAYEVVEGTTIYHDAINPSATATTVQPTDSPDLNFQTEPLATTNNIEIQPENFVTTEKTFIAAENINTVSTEKPLTVSENVNVQQESLTSENVQIEDNKNDEESTKSDSLIDNLLSPLTDWINDNSTDEDDEEEDAVVEAEDGEEDKPLQSEEHVEVESNTKSTSSENEVKQEDVEEDKVVEAPQPLPVKYEEPIANTNHEILKDKLEEASDTLVPNILDNVTPPPVDIVPEPQLINAINEEAQSEENFTPVSDVGSEITTTFFAEIAEELLLENVTPDPGKDTEETTTVSPASFEENKNNEETVPVNPSSFEEIVSVNPPSLEESVTINPLSFEETGKVNPNFEETVTINPPSFEETVKVNPLSFEESDTINPHSFEETVKINPNFEETAAINPSNFEETVKVNPPSLEESVATNPSGFEASLTVNSEEVVEEENLKQKLENEESKEFQKDVDNDKTVDSTIVENQKSEEVVEEATIKTSDSNNNEEISNNYEDIKDSPGFLSSIFSIFGSSAEKIDAEEILDSKSDLNENEISEDNNENINFIDDDAVISKHYSVLVITAVTILLFLLGYIFIDKNRREGPLIAKINNLEKELLIRLKECEVLNDKLNGTINTDDGENFSSDYIENLKSELEESKNTQLTLEEQIQTLEKELENSTEVGLELNRMLSDILNSQNGSDILIANVEQLQRQLVEQQDTINTINETLTIKNTENHELNLELDISNKKVLDLQNELDKMVLNLLKIEEEKDQQQNTLETETLTLKEQLQKCDINFNLETTKLKNEISILNNKLNETDRNLQIKLNELKLLKESASELKGLKNNNENFKAFLDITSIKAELEQLKKDKEILSERLCHEQENKNSYEKQIEIVMQEMQKLKSQYDDADKQKLEAQTKLEVLSTYFKTKEAELQKELSKQENMWIEKQGEATSTIERIQYMQEELQNCKAQNELLKQEIVSQEVELKSHISVLEKKAHENWLLARQSERRLEDAKQEAAQLRNRLTLRERNLNDDKHQNRVQSPHEHNGELPASPLHMNVESPASPPLLFGAHEHMTTSPPLPGLPPFLPPPPGVPFMPPPLHGVPPFLPHLPFPSDHRPAPLGRLPSPPLNSRYSPDSRAYSPYDRNSPSPPYDSEYSPSSPTIPRIYSPYNNRIDERKDYKRPPPVRKSRNTKVSGTLSSGSGNSNESLEKINRHSSKV